MFEQVLQVMVTQGASMDSLRSELSSVRSDFKKQLADRDQQLREYKAEVQRTREEKESLNTFLDKYATENASLKAKAEGKHPADQRYVSIHDHERTVKRIQEEARSSVQQAEAELSRLTVHLKQFQIRNAQLQNQVDARNYPESVLDELTEHLKQAVLEALENGTFLKLHIDQADSTRRSR